MKINGEFVKPSKDPEQTELIKEMYKIWEEQMTREGFEVKQYQGRFYYQGPAIFCEDSDEFAKAKYLSPCKTQWEEFGKRGYVVYPAYTILSDRLRLEADLNMIKDPMTKKILED